MQLLKQSTAATILVGPVSSADAAYTGAAISDFNITKNGTTAALASPATATHSHNGYYLIALGTGNVDTLGRVDISLNATAYFMTLHRYTVVTANQFDALITNGTATPAAIASQTRTELTTELARIDVATSTRLASSSYTTPPTAAANADAVWDEAYSGHTTAGTFGKLMDILRKANNAIEATITSDVTPTATTFSVSLTAYPTGAFVGSVLMMIDGNRIDQNAPILTFTNNTTFSTIVLESPLTGVPAVGDTILIDATSHVHSIAEIVSGVWSALTSGLSVVGSTGRALARLIGLVQDSGGDRFTAKALEEAPAGGGGAGDASQATLLLVKAKTDLITSQTANQQQTPVNQMVIIRGDSYSGATRKTHAVTTDYTGYTATFTIRHRVTDAVLLSVSGAVDSSTQLSVTLTTSNTAFALLVDPTEFGPHPYDFRLVNGAVEKTESGIAIIRRDVTRA